MIIKVQTYEQFHNKKSIGSTKIRIHNLLKHWDEASLYKYGEKADVMIFQKVYVTYDYKFPLNFPGISILDTCDPDWWSTPDIHIAETVKGVDAVVVPTENMRKLLQQMTDKPVRIIKDRFELTDFPAKKQHTGNLRTAVWYGYSHNSELLRYAITSLEKRGIRLKIISNDDPMIWRFADNPEEYRNLTEFVKYKQETIYEELKKADVCILPKGYRPQDKYKSENRTIQAQLCGLPVVSNAEELDAMIEPEARNKAITDIYDKIRNEYDCKKSVIEWKELINELRS